MNKLVAMLLTAALIGAAGGTASYAGPGRDRGSQDTKAKGDRGGRVSPPPSSRAPSGPRVDRDPPRSSPRVITPRQDPPRVTPGPSRADRGSWDRGPSGQKPVVTEPRVRTPLPEPRGGSSALRDRTPQFSTPPKADVPRRDFSPPGITGRDRGRTAPPKADLPTRVITPPAASSKLRPDFEPGRRSPVPEPSVTPGKPDVPRAGLVPRPGGHEPPVVRDGAGRPAIGPPGGKPGIGLPGGKPGLGPPSGKPGLGPPIGKFDPRRDDRLSPGARDRDRDRMGPPPLGHKPDFGIGPRPPGRLPPPHFRPDSFDRYYVKHGWYHGDWHHGYWKPHWHQDYHVPPVAWWGTGFVTGLAMSYRTPWDWGYWSYWNPYCSGPVVVERVVVDYSRPVVVVDSPEVAPVVEGQPDPAAQAAELLTEARNSFAAGQYAVALTQVDRAIAKTPADPALHEFRSLVLFTQGRYRDAAAAIHSVLAARPGWDWETLSGLYPDVNVYTEHLRALEKHRRDNPDAADARFLLAYHYMTIDQPEAAATELKEVLRINPRDALAQQLLNGLATEDQPPSVPPAAGADAGAPAASPAPAAGGDVALAPADGATPPAPLPGVKPADAAALAGDWTASQPDGRKFRFHLGADNQFTWEFTEQDKTQQFSGTFALADGVLILRQGDEVAMIAEVRLLPDNKLRFQLAGNPADPGLTFSR